MKATGTFEVNLQPLEFSAQAKEGLQLGRMSINKTFAGDLIGTSQGEMLSAMTTVKGSAGYVALEQFEGTLNGKKGTFALQHFGIMNKGADRLILEVIPDSGTGALVGLSGKMELDRKEGGHSFVMEYKL